MSSLPVSHLKSFALCAALIAPPVLFSAAACAESARHPSLRAAIEKDYPRLETLYRHFHQNPELSRQEFKTADRLAAELEALGYSLTRNIGITGLVATLKNGEGPTLLIRADMDALPVEENSGLPFASKARQINLDGKEMPVMHACGHDMHITSLVGVAKQMVELKDKWSGTLLLVGQPDEEMIGGARLMVEDGLYEKVGRPDYALALHVIAKYPAGKIALNDGIMYSSADTVNIRVRGVAAHGASPHLGNDSVVIGSQIVLALQNIVTREISPIEPAVITVGAFNGGSAPNVIADHADLQITVRANTEATRAKLIDSIRRVAINTARAAGVSEEHLPIVERLGAGSPTTTNDAALAKRVRSAILGGMGESAFTPWHQTDMGAEDFPDMVNVDPPIPSVYFEVGGSPREQVEKGTFASHHSPLFKIEHEVSIKAGVEGMTLAAMALLKK